MQVDYERKGCDKEAGAQCFVLCDIYLHAGEVLVSLRDAACRNCTKAQLSIGLSVMSRSIVSLLAEDAMYQS